MDIDIIVPEGLQDITLEQYQKFLALKSKDDMFLTQKAVEIFCNVPLILVDKMPYNTVQRLAKRVFSYFEGNPSLVKRKRLKSVLYGFTPNLEDITLGEYVDLDVESTKWGLKITQPGARRSVQAASAPARQQNNSTRTAAQKSKQFPVDPDSKDHIIIRQNALTNANAAVASAIAAGAKYKSAEEVFNEVIKVAYNLTGFAMGTLDATLVAEARAKQEDA